MYRYTSPSPALSWFFVEKHLLYFRKVTKTTPAISNLKGKLAALELEQAQDEAAEQEHAEASMLAAKIAALEEQKKKKVAATKALEAAKVWLSIQQHV